MVVGCGAAAAGARPGRGRRVATVPVSLPRRASAHAKAAAESRGPVATSSLNQGSLLSIGARARRGGGEASSPYADARASPLSLSLSLPLSLSAPPAATTRKPIPAALAPIPLSSHGTISTRSLSWRARDGERARDSFPGVSDAPNQNCLRSDTPSFPQGATHIHQTQARPLVSSARLCSCARARALDPL